MTTDFRKDKPLVYSCSGCSSAAQMANYLAIQLDRSGIAEMSCIAGVGGNVKKLVKTALSGRKIIVIDGCPLACSKACLGNHSITPDLNFELTSFGIKKKQHEDFNKEEADSIRVELQKRLLKHLTYHAGKPKTRYHEYRHSEIYSKREGSDFMLL